MEPDMMEAVCKGRCVRDSVCVALTCPHFETLGLHDMERAGRKEHMEDLQSGDVALKPGSVTH